MEEVISSDWTIDSDDYISNMHIYVNSATPVETSGFELEANYDAGFAYARLSFSHENTSQPTSIASGSFGAGDIGDLPEDFFNLDAGVRFLDKKLVFGSLVKFTGTNQKLSPDQEYNETSGALEKVKNEKNPIIIDLYRNYQISKNLSVRLSVQNLMNKNYSEALNRLNSNPSQSSGESPANTARGRTYLVGAEFRV